MALSFALDNVTTTSDWVPLIRPTIVRTWGTWQGSWQVHVSANADGSDAAPYTAAVADTDAVQALKLDVPKNMATMYYAVVFTYTSGTLEGEFGNGVKL